MAVENVVKFKDVQMEEKVLQIYAQLTVGAYDVNSQIVQAVLLVMGYVKHMVVEDDVR
jgi:hypothetical protein